MYGEKACGTTYKVRHHEYSHTCKQLELEATRRAEDVVAIANRTWMKVAGASRITQKKKGLFLAVDEVRLWTMIMMRIKE